MRILYVGDVVGRAGRDIFVSEITDLRQRLQLDAVIVNGENAAGGFGLTPAIADQFLSVGADVITTGNHVWDQRALIGAIDATPRIIRPGNLKKGAPGKGMVIVETENGSRLAVLQIMGHLFMGAAYADPFESVDDMLTPLKLGANIDAVIVDIHAEATSEKMAFGHHVDGRATLVAGTHTHVPTADHMILEHGTAYVTDIGMTGDYDSVIGMNKHTSLHRFRSPLPGERMTPALGEATLCGVFVETHARTGRAIRCEPLRIGGRLSSVVPAP